MGFEGFDRSCGVMGQRQLMMSVLRSGDCRAGRSSLSTWTSGIGREPER